MEKFREKDSYIIRFAEEKDTKKIYDFIDLKIKENRIDFISPKTSIDYYNESLIRSNLYSFMEDFIVLENNNEIKSMISFGLPNTLSKYVNLNLVILEDKKYLSELIEFAKNNLHKMSVVEPVNINILLSIKEDNHNVWKKHFEEVGFKVVDRSPYEIGVEGEVASLQQKILVEKELAI